MVSRRQDLRLSSSREEGREREREREERGLVKPPSLSTPFRSVPPFLDRVCTHHLFPRRIPIPPSGGGDARGRPLTARRAVYLAV